MPLVGNPKRILLDLAGQHHLPELLPLAMRRLTESPAIALVRIWLLQPPLADDCGHCRLASECGVRDRCLHLAASAGRSLRDSNNLWDGLNGRFRRFPFGVRKVGHIAKSGQSIEVSNLDENWAWVADPEWLRDEQIRAFVGHPLIHREEVLGVLGVFAREPAEEACTEWLRMIADHLATAIANSRALDEIEALKKRLELENEYLREEVRSSISFGDLVGQSPALQAVVRQIDLVAPTDSTVLIQGESGTGKELVAREIHRRSGRANQPLIKVNCAAISRELYESEFFGHARGAFTGALRDRVGRFELADRGTLFLDEIGEIPLELQAKLLRVLQEGELERVGEERTRRVDVRIIAATNRNLRKEAEAGRFRQDLYYRLSVFPMEMPALRHRIEDVPLLADHFLQQIARRLGRRRPRLSLTIVQQLQRYTWPGNVRELQHVLERACIVAPEGRLELDLPTDTANVESRANSEPQERVLTEHELRVLEASNLRRALEISEGKIYGTDGAAALVGLKPTTLVSRLKALGIKVGK